MSVRRKPQAGADIDSYCSRCKLLLAHVIIAMNGSRVARVECKTCRSVHVHRGIPGAVKSGSSASDKPKARGSSRAAIGANDYDRLMNGRDLSRSKAYKITVRFDKDDVLNHRTFGLGLITRLLEEDKVEVAFQTGIKVLVHGRGAQ